MVVYGRIACAGMIAVLALSAPAAETAAVVHSGGCAAPQAQTAQAPYAVPDFAPEADRSADAEVDAARAETAMAAWRAYRDSIFAALRASPDPRDRAMAAYIGGVGRGLDADGASNPARAALLRNAARDAPNDALVQWIALLQSPGDVSARAEALRVLSRLEPENGAVWQMALIEARRRTDSAGVDAALAAMAASTRFDTHYAELLGLTLDAFRRFPPPDELAGASPHLAGAKGDAVASAYALAFAITASAALPAFQDLITACRADPASGRNLTHAADCARIGRLLAAKGDTMIANRIGFAVLRVARSWDADDAASARNTDWIIAQSAQIDPDGEDLAAFAAYQQDWINAGSEIAAIRQRVAHAGIALRPPPDWVDSASPFSEERLRQDAAAIAAAHDRIVANPGAVQP